MKKDDSILHWRTMYESTKTMMNALLHQIIRLKKENKMLKNKKGDFRKRDAITGKKLDNPLNKTKLSKHELDDIMLGEDDDI